jgi:hypothetical protein
MKRILFIFSCLFVFAGCSRIENLRLSVNVIESFNGTKAHELSRAVMFQNINEIKEICKENPKLMYIEDRKYHYTLLHYAVKLSKYKSAKALLECGMSPNVQSSLSGETPLFLAAKYSDVDIKFMKLLAEYGADPELCARAVNDKFSTDGETPLMQLPSIYVSEQKSNLEKAKFMVEVLKANVNAKDKNGRTAAIEALHVQDARMAHYFIVELKADVVEPCYFPDFVKPEGEEKRQFMPVSILRDWWNYPSDSKEYKIKLEIIKEFERQGVDYNAVEAFSSFKSKAEQKLVFSTITKPTILAEKASAMEKELVKLPMVKSAAVYDYDEDVSYSRTTFEIELILKNGDRIELYGVKSDLKFQKERSAGILSINDVDFTYRRDSNMPWIPSEDLAAVLGKNEYVDVGSFLNDYNIIKNFLLYTPYGTKTGFFSDEATFYFYEDTYFQRY